MVMPYTAPLPHGGQRQYGGQPTRGQWDGTRFIYTIKGQTYKVARLVCEAFHGTPQPNFVCIHMDENSRNNCPDNLQWGTQRDNLNAPGFLTYCRSRTGANSTHFKARANAGH